MTPNFKILLASALFSFSYAIPLQGREVPQEHSHESLKDPVTGLRGNYCNDKDDPKGCIFTKKLLQVKATPEGIKAAINTGGGSNISTASESSSIDSKVGIKIVAKRGQVTSNPQTFSKAAPKPNEFPKTIPRENDGTSLESNNEKVKRDLPRNHNYEVQNVDGPNFSKDNDKVERDLPRNHNYEVQNVDGPNFSKDNDKVKRDDNKNIRQFRGGKPIGNRLGGLGRGPQTN